ncbi:MAG: hypothetical protein NVSMB46_01040 [Candidatus Saccharimonadales bacterium]
MKRKLRDKLKNKKDAVIQALPNANSQQLKEDVPRITNDTVAAHRDEVLGKARKYIYPLQHSKHRIVVISASLFVIVVIAFFSYCGLALYKFQSNSTFLYRVTQVIPFPIAKVGSKYISYENYLFQLRHYTHYYQTQEQVNFQSSEGKQRLTAFKQQAIHVVTNEAYIKQLAEENNIKVSDREVNDEIIIVRKENRLGSSDKVFEDVLKEYWGWSVDDFKRSLKQQLLAQKVVSILDVKTHQKAEAALMLLKSGSDFASVAKQYSEDAATRDNGGEYGASFARSNRDLPTQTTDTLFKLPVGQYSDILNTGYTLEIVKNVSMNGDKIHAAHIVFNFKDISFYINSLIEKEKPHIYIKH